MELTDIILYSVISVIVILYFLSGLRTVRQTHRAVIERFGKFTRIKANGLTWIIPFVEKMYQVNITEQITEAEQQEIITLDRLNAKISAQVYFKVKEDDESVYNSFYHVNRVLVQIVALARTTLRNEIGKKNFPDVNSNRTELNIDIAKSIQEQVNKWGIEIVRVELKEIDPPVEVQEAMNQISVAQSNKKSAEDFAIAVATKADGEKNAQIKKAEGEKQSAILTAEGKANALKTVAQGTKDATILQAEGEAQAIKTVAQADAEKIKIVSISANENFDVNAQLYMKYQVTENSLKDNSKVIFTKDGVSPVVVISDDKENIIPIKTSDKKKS